MKTIVKTLKHKSKLTKSYITALVISFTLVAHAFDSSGDNINQASDAVINQVEGDGLIYSPTQMLSFSISDYLQKNAPHLVNKVEVISHWAGRTTVSPKVFIALIEQQSGLISNEFSETDERPFGNLSIQDGFDRQLEDVAHQLVKLMYSPSPNTEIKNLLVSDTSVLEFNEIFFRLFPEEMSIQNLNIQAVTKADSNSIPPANMLALPYPKGQGWYFGGAHSNSGSGLVLSSLDFLKDFDDFGDDVSDWVVTSAASGTVVIHSKCGVEVIHEGGWSTSYYHLDKIRVVEGDKVLRNQKIAGVADNIDQATCDDGSSKVPHQHFALKKGGRFHSLQGVQLSRYTVNVGESDYDDRCDRFWIKDSDGRKRCAFEDDGTRRTLAH